MTSDLVGSLPPESVGPLPPKLQARLNMIIQTTPLFWSNNKNHVHFTNHGPEHSERVHTQKLAQLAQELPEASRLTSDEVFVVSAAAWLYEIGMQSPSLKPVLDVEFRPGDSLPFPQLQEIRENKHLLSERLIIDSVRRDYQGPPLQLGMVSPGDDYSQLIAEVCSWCSSEPLENVPETSPVGGVPVRVRLLVALLRLADQLYIDRSRVNLDLLERADLAEDQFARWWAYYYAQTLPVARGQIRFHYFLPVTQKEYLGHIRALIEPQFKYENNPTLRYLFDQGLRLAPHVIPSLKFDQPAGFQRQMSSELISYLRRKVRPMEVPPEILSVVPDEEPEDRSLLVLDYESFVLQLGQQGHFFMPGEIDNLMVDLLMKARSEYGGLVDGWAMGHWDRPDLAPVARTLEEKLYEALFIGSHENLPERLEQELIQRIQEPGRSYRRIILVAPSSTLASTAKKLIEDRQLVNAWLSDLPEANIFGAVVQKPKYLRDLLPLHRADKVDPARLVDTQNACILRIDRETNSGKKTLAFDEIRSVLSQVEQTYGQTDWWRLWLLNRGILKGSYLNQQYYVQLDVSHPDVAQLYNMREIVIQTLGTASDGDERGRQDRLTRELLQTPYFRHEEAVLAFLTLLKEEDVVHLDARPSLPDRQPLWHLNPSDSVVVASNADQHLPRFALLLDHILVRAGYPFLHEHTLGRHMAPHMSSSVLETVYKLALSENIVNRRESYDKKYRREVVNVSLSADHPVVGVMMRNRDILLNILYHRSARDGLQREILWNRLEAISGFMLCEDELDQWINSLERDSVVAVARSEQHPGQDVIKLNLDTLLTQHLLGRMNVYGLIRNLRLMRATRQDQKKPSGELVDRLTRYVTNHDRQLAQWTLAYAEDIKLARSEGASVYLAKHGIVQGLDWRERSTCQAVTELVGTLAGRWRNGWVPRGVVIKEMENDGRFGFLRGEHDYWLDQTTHRLKLLEEQKERRNGRLQLYVRVARTK